MFGGRCAKSLLFLSLLYFLFFLIICYPFTRLSCRARFVVNALIKIKGVFCFFSHYLSLSLSLVGIVCCLVIAIARCWWCWAQIFDTRECELVCVVHMCARAYHHGLCSLIRTIARCKYWNDFRLFYAIKLSLFARSLSLNVYMAHHFWLLLLLFCYFDELWFYAKIEKFKL